MEANKVNDSHRPPTDGGMAKEEFIRVGTTLYKIVEQPTRPCAKTMARTTSAAYPSMTASAPYPNTSAISL